MLQEGHFLLSRPGQQIPEPDTVRECERPRRKPDWRAQQSVMAMGICFFRKGGQRWPLSTGRRKRGASRPRSGDQHSRWCSRQAEQAETWLGGSSEQRGQEGENGHRVRVTRALQAAERHLDFIPGGGNLTQWFQKGNNLTGSMNKYE